jgi:hypothetical protein
LSRKLPPSWNRKKANWDLFRQLADTQCSKIPLKRKSITQNANRFSQAILTAAKGSIPRGRKQNYQPFWNRELDEKHKHLTNARDIMEDDPSDSNITTHNKAKAEYQRAKMERIRKSWQEKYSKLSLERYTQQLWNLTKSLNEEQTSRARVVLRTDNGLVSGKNSSQHLRPELPQEKYSRHAPREKKAN